VIAPAPEPDTIRDLTHTMHRSSAMKVFGIAGWSDSGKTTLIERLLPLLTERGLRVSIVKHAHEKFDIDKPGKDSFRFREAGSHEVLISSPARWALMREHRGDDEPGLPELLSHLSDCDLALIEGFKRDPIAKLEVHRVANGKPLLFPDDPDIVAIASDVPVASELPQFQLDDVERIAAFIVAATVGVGGVGRDGTVP
jgi:molybdopterin-guanine dinucleotide biosynthesis protein B